MRHEIHFYCECYYKKPMNKSAFDTSQTSLVQNRQSPEDKRHVQTGRVSNQEPRIGMQVNAGAYSDWADTRLYRVFQNMCTLLGCTAVGKGTENLRAYMNAQENECSLTYER